MKLHGWCTSCRRVKLVRVSGPHMIAQAGRHVVSGICDDCEGRAR